MTKEFRQRYKHGMIHKMFYGRCGYLECVTFSVYGTRRMSVTDFTMADSSWTMHSQFNQYNNFMSRLLI